MHHHYQQQQQNAYQSILIPCSGMAVRQNVGDVQQNFNLLLKYCIFNKYFKTVIKKMMEKMATNWYEVGMQCILLYADFSKSTSTQFNSIQNFALRQQCRHTLIDSYGTPFHDI